MQPVKLPRVLQHLALCLPAGHPLGQVSYCQDCSLNTPYHTHTHTANRPLLCLSGKRAINTPPPTACTHVMEDKKRAEEEDSKGKEEMLERGKEERGRKAGEKGSVSDGECRASGQRVKEQGKKER